MKSNMLFLFLITSFIGAAPSKVNYDKNNNSIVADWYRNGRCVTVIKFCKSGEFECLETVFGDRGYLFLQCIITPNPKIVAQLKAKIALFSKQKK